MRAVHLPRLFGPPLVVEFASRHPLITFDLKTARIAELRVGHGTTFEVPPSAGRPPSADGPSHSARCTHPEPATPSWSSRPARRAAPPLDQAQAFPLVLAQPSADARRATRRSPRPTTPPPALPDVARRRRSPAHTAWPSGSSPRPTAPRTTPTDVSATAAPTRTSAMTSPTGRIAALDLQPPDCPSPSASEPEAGRPRGRWYPVDLLRHVPVERPQVGLGVPSECAEPFSRAERTCQRRVRVAVHEAPSPSCARRSPIKGSGHGPPSASRATRIRH